MWLQIRLSTYYLEMEKRAHWGSENAMKTPPLGMQRFQTKTEKETLICDTRLALINTSGSHLQVFPVFNLNPW